jgi:hypothetical membrane protein
MEPIVTTKGRAIMSEQNKVLMRRAIVRSSRVTSIRILALGGVAGPVLFVLITAVSAALRPDYSQTTSFISELGASGTPHAPIMNYLGFVPAGLLLAAFGISLVRIMSPHVLAVAGSALVVLFGVGVAASGIISCDPGCPVSGGSLENTLHNVIGPFSFIALACGIGLLGIEFRRLAYFRPLSLYSFVTSVLGLLLIVAIVGSLEAKTLTGLWQRLLLATLFLWCAVIGIRAFRYHRQQRHTF